MFGKIKKVVKIASCCIFICFFFIQNTFAAERLLFLGDTNYSIEQNTLVLDSNDSTGDVFLQFGLTLAEKLFWDTDGGDGSGIFNLSDGLTIEEILAVGIAVPASVTHIYENSINTGSSAGLTIENAGIGDAILQLLITGSQRWVLGIDNSDSDKLKIASSSDLNSDTAFILDPSGQLTLPTNGNTLVLGDGTASDITMSFNNGSVKNFGWDNSESSFSTFDQPLAFRTSQSSSPPATCSSTLAGMQWYDTDTGITYICDTSNSRNKWLSFQDIPIFGDESGACAAGNNPDNDANCNVDWGNGLGPDGATDLGFYIPYPMTITAYGFSADNDACTSGSFDLEVWTTNSNTQDNTYSYEADIATVLTGEAHNANNLNVDIGGNQYILWGIDNNCGQSIDDWNLVIYYRWRHN